jgi:hypothetical protein
VLACDVVDQLLDEHGLADARAAEEADLAAAHVGRDEVDDLDARLEDLDLRREIAEARRIAMDRPALARCLFLAVDRIADHVPDAAERLVAHGHRDRTAGVDDLRAAGEAVGRVHGDRAHPVVAEMLLYLGDELASVDGDAECVVYLGQSVWEHGVEHDALDLDDAAPITAVRACVGHESPESVERIGVRRGEI